MKNYPTPQELIKELLAQGHVRPEYPHPNKPLSTRKIAKLTGAHFNTIQAWKTKNPHQCPFWAFRKLLWLRGFQITKDNQ